MNKLVLGAIIFVAAMLGFTYISVLGSKGGINGDIVNQLAVVGAVALVLISVFVVVKYVRQMQNDTATGQLADENWDGIGEYKNELPFGWAIIFFGLIIWGMWYFTMGYPVNAYSQIGEYNEDTAAHNAKFQKEYANITGDRLVDMGESVFLAECKVCHGLTADGIDGKAADLNHRIAKSSVIYTVKHGANNLKTDFPGGMPMGLDAMFGEGELDKVASYVANGFPESDSEGAALFEKGTCTGCHGAKGEGMPFAGPKLNAFDVATVTSVLKDGKKANIGTMPSFANRLNDKQIEAAAAYISSLSK